MYEVAKHKKMHIAHAYMPATNCLCCMWDYHTKQRAIVHFKATKHMFPLAEAQALAMARKPPRDQSLHAGKHKHASVSMDPKGGPLPKLHSLRGVRGHGQTSQSKTR